MRKYRTSGQELAPMQLHTNHSLFFCPYGRGNIPRKYTLKLVIWQLTHFPFCSDCNLYVQRNLKQSLMMTLFLYSTTDCRGQPNCRKSQKVLFFIFLMEALFSGCLSCIIKHNHPHKWEMCMHVEGKISAEIFPDALTDYTIKWQQEKQTCSWKYSLLLENSSEIFFFSLKCVLSIPIHSHPTRLQFPIQMLENSTEDGSLLLQDKTCELAREKVNTLSELMIHITEKKGTTAQSFIPIIP